jgi:tRNA-splicing ligase RtcB
MSRRAAHQSVDWKATERLLAERDVTLLSAGIDEAPAVYKNIHDVMNAQQDLVDIVARFMPRIVKMAPSGEPPED